MVLCESDSLIRGLVSLGQQVHINTGWYYKDLDVHILYITNRKFTFQFISEFACPDSFLK